VTNPDRDCEGHGGYLVTDLVSGGKRASEPAAWFATGKAEVALMHFGTNDVWNNVAPGPILNAYSTLVDGLRSVTPNVVVFVAQIIPMNPSGCAECANRVIQLNSQIPAWAAGESTSSSPIYVVDQWTGFDTATDTGDGVHPNLAGSQKMANKWSAALIARGIF
jgi:lysophospholipase L1-like esterase